MSPSHSSPYPKEPPPSPTSLLPASPHPHTPTNTIIIAYSSSGKKQKFFDYLIQVAENWVGHFGPHRTPLSVKFLPLPEECPSSLYFHPVDYHAIMHKRSDDLAAARANNNPLSTHRINQLSDIINYAEALRPDFYGLPPNPTKPTFPVVPIDPMEGVWRLADRISILQAIDNAFGPSSDHSSLPSLSNISLRAWTTIPVREGLDAVRDALQDNLHFPVILKRRVACGSQMSHEMVVAYDIQGAINAIETYFGADLTSSSYHDDDYHVNHVSTNDDDFANDLVAQEFVTNHGGVIFKIYVIGSNVIVQPRSSIEHPGNIPAHGYLSFDSQTVSRGRYYSFNPQTGFCKDTEALMPSRRLAKSIATITSKELGLSLFGVDLVYDIAAKSYVLVDINYFPGFKDMDNACDMILEHACEQVWQHLQH